MWVWVIGMTLDELISGLGRLGEELQTKVAEQVAPTIKGLLDAQIAAGTDPDGNPWQRNQDGSQPLEGAQKYVQVNAVGNSIVVRLDEPLSYHQTGTSRLPQRKIVPTGDLPVSWEEAIQEAVDEVVNNGTLNLR